MSNVLVVGTSHTTDKHAYYEKDGQKYYCKYKEGELTWSQYLANKLNMNHIDCAIGGFGIETYATRILSITDDYDIALLEIPDYYRNELYVEQENITYKPNYLLDNEFWKDNEIKKYFQEVVRYNPSDYDCNKTTINKINRVNKNAVQPLTLEDFKASIRNTVRHNEHLQNDKIYAKITMINGYLKSKKVLPIWFSYQFELPAYDQTDFIIVNDQIEFKTIKDYVKNNLKYDFNDVNYAGDGVHLNSNHWRKLVDDLFVNFIKRRM